MLEGVPSRWPSLHVLECLWNKETALLNRVRQLPAYGPQVVGRDIGLYGLACGTPW